MLKREKYLDIVKGISIVSITFLHYENGILPTHVNTFIGSFMITAFYITSGWISAMSPSKLSLQEYVRKRWKQLGIPYLCWSLIILLFDALLWLFSYYDSYFIARETYKFLVLRGIGTLWFLPALFGGELIWRWLQIKRKYYLIIVFIISCLYQAVYTSFEWGDGTLNRIIDAPFRTISNILNAYIYIVFGYYAYKLYFTKLHCSKRIMLMIAGIILCCIAYYTANYLPNSFSLFWPYLAPVIGPMGLILLAKVMQECKVLNYFAFWGRNSLLLMVTHYSIIMVTFQLIVEKCLHLDFNGWCNIVCFIISMLLQYLMVKPINKYAHILIGK